MNHPFHICATLMALLFSAGCNKNLDGEFGILQFSDMTKRPGFEFDVFSDSVDRPVTTNSIYRVRLSEPNLSAGQLRTGDERIVKVIATRPISELIDGEETITATEVLTHTGRPGSTRLVVELEQGRMDYVTITVIEQTKTEVVIAPDKQRFVDHDGAALADSEVALLPGAEIQLFGQALDQSGEYLSGSNSSQWVVDGTGIGLVDDSDEDDFVMVKAMEIAQDNAIRFGASEPISIPTISEDSVASITILPQFIVQPDAGSVVLLHVAFRTDDGRFVIGDGTAPVQMTLNDGLRIVDPDQTDGHIALYNAFLKPDPDSSRDIFVKSDTAGQFTVVAEWNGLSDEHTLTIH